MLFINVHSPTEDKKNGEKDEFYSSLNNIMNEIPINTIQIILGDFKAKIGTK